MINCENQICSKNLTSHTYFRYEDVCLLHYCKLLNSYNILIPYLTFMIPKHIFWYSWEVVANASQINKTACIDEEVWPSQYCDFRISSTIKLGKLLDFKLKPTNNRQFYLLANRWSCWNLTFIISGITAKYAKYNFDLVYWIFLNRSTFLSRTDIEFPFLYLFIVSIERKNTTFLKYLF